MHNVRLMSKYDLSSLLDNNRYFDPEYQNTLVIGLGFCDTNIVVEISIRHPINLEIIFLLLHKFLWKFVWCLDPMGISIHIQFYNNFLPKEYQQNFVFEGGNNFKTVLKNCLFGLLQTAKGRISACADYKKTLMILSHMSLI